MRKYSKNTYLMIFMCKFIALFNFYKNTQIKFIWFYDAILILTNIIVLCNFQIRSCGSDFSRSNERLQRFRSRLDASVQCRLHYRWYSSTRARDRAQRSRSLDQWNVQIVFNGSSYASNNRHHSQVNHSPPLNTIFFFLLKIYK